MAAKLFTCNNKARAENKASTKQFLNLGFFQGKSFMQMTLNKLLEHNLR